MYHSYLYQIHLIVSRIPFYFLKRSDPYVTQLILIKWYDWISRLFSRYQMIIQHIPKHYLITSVFRNIHLNLLSSIHLILLHAFFHKMQLKPPLSVFYLNSDTPASHFQRLPLVYEYLL